MESSRSLTVTQRDQLLVEHNVFKIYKAFYEIPPNAKSLMLELQRDKHVEYLTRGLEVLPPSFCVVDATRPWVCYWILHSIALLGEFVDHDLEDNVIDFLSRCQDPNGGYGGGPGQMPHLATTYAAINALVTLGGDKALMSINREKLYLFLRSMKDSNGAFRMHDGGEIDVRACYTAISVASILNILDAELIQGVGNYILSCQTYEGGIAGEPGSEAHGGYTFCGLAAMVLINEVNRLDLARLIDWVVFRQGVEGGFQGRTNKLVDGCYSFWQGGVFAVLKRLLLTVGNGGEGGFNLESQPMDVARGQGSSDGILPHSDSDSDQSGEHDASSRHAQMEPLFNSIALQQYILLCSQDLEGGLRDKPGKGRDHYHSCYCLSGLSVCQHSWSKDDDSTPSQAAVVGPYSNLLEPIHPLYNVVLDQYREAHEFFLNS